MFYVYVTYFVVSLHILLRPGDGFPMVTFWFTFISNMDLYTIVIECELGF